VQWRIADSSFAYESAKPKALLDLQMLAASRAALAALDSLMAAIQDGRLCTRVMLDEQDALYRDSFDGFFHTNVAPRSFGWG
jgi:hypothetical protein